MRGIPGRYMSPPKTAQDLAESIETLVASFIEQSRRCAELAVARSFDMAGGKARSAEGDGRHPRVRRSAKRRSGEELAGLRCALYEGVCARPGESMTVFAGDIGCSVRDLQRPMSQLKDAGQIRCVGERNATRYFPAVGARRTEP